MAALLASCGWNAKIDRAGNVTATLPAARGGALAALTAHLDTVLAPRRPEEIRVEANGTFTGPGVSDNGAGLAALAAVARALGEHPAAMRAGQLLLVANVGEEGEGNLSGMRYLCQQSAWADRLHSLVVLDGPDVGHVTATALASRRFEVAVSGPGGHSWSDRGMANPVHVSGPRRRLVLRRARRVASGRSVELELRRDRGRNHCQCDPLVGAGQGGSAQPEPGGAGRAGGGAGVLFRAGRAPGE